MRFELDELQLEAQDTISKIVLEDDALARLDEFGAFDPSLVVVTFQEIGNAGLVVPEDRYGEPPALAAAAHRLPNREAPVTRSGRGVCCKALAHTSGMPSGTATVVRRITSRADGS